MLYADAVAELADGWIATCTARELSGFAFSVPAHVLNVFLYGIVKMGR